MIWDTAFPCVDKPLLRLIQFAKGLAVNCVNLYTVMGGPDCWYANVPSQVMSSAHCHQRLLVPWCIKAAEWSTFPLRGSPAPQLITLVSCILSLGGSRPVGRLPSPLSLPVPPPG